MVRFFVNPEEMEQERLILTGEVDEAPDTAALTEQLSLLCWQLELRDQTRLRRDLWHGCGEDSLRGLFLTNLREEYEKADGRPRFRDVKAQVIMTVCLFPAALLGQGLLYLLFFRLVAHVL